MGKINVVRAASKGELQDLHAGIAAGVQHFCDFFGEKAKILCDYVHAAKLFVHSFEKSHVRPLSPLSFPGILCTVRDTVITFKSTEVVDPYSIVHL